jgi:TPR repeat protein
MTWRNPWILVVPLVMFAPAAALADVGAEVDAWSRGDYPLAIREWQAPAERGDADALFNLGQAYKLGRGVKADLAKAEDLFGRAVAKGHLQAADLPAPVPSGPPTAMRHHTMGPGRQATKSRKAETMDGWAVQLGAFAMKQNADALRNRVAARAELAGTARPGRTVGSVTWLTAAGFRTREQAVSACDALGAAKISCIVVRN